MPRCYCLLVNHVGDILYRLRYSLHICKGVLRIDLQFPARHPNTVTLLINREGGLDYMDCRLRIDLSSFMLYCL